MNDNESRALDLNCINQILGTVLFLTQNELQIKKNFYRNIEAMQT